MSTLLSRRLALLGQGDHLSLLTQCLHGIEREGLRGTDFSRGLLQFNKVRGDGLQTLNQTRIWFSR